MKKILIIGSHGMAGHVIKKILLETDRFLIFDIARSDQYGKVSYQMDVTNFDKLKKQFGLDGIEEHTLINQGTQYRGKLDVVELITEIAKQSGDDRRADLRKDDRLAEC